MLEERIAVFAIPTLCLLAGKFTVDMVGLPKRMRLLKEVYLSTKTPSTAPSLTPNQKLFAIRYGPGAALLPKDVKRIHMDFAVKIYDGHHGARKFWRNCLPRLKYHNPAVSMTINRTTDQSGPATLSIFFAPPLTDSNSPTASPAPTQSASTHHTTSNHEPFERVEAIDIKNLPESEILRRLMSATKAMGVEPSVEERAEMERLAEERKRSEIDRERMELENLKRKREKALLDMARGGMETAKKAAAAS
ncbi:MAG: hypothetical protein MMC33_003094 [Icmadophila ericetorum]|nr:hypothetical protein [Icmadophila ericetorum]